MTDPSGVPFSDATAISDAVRSGRASAGAVLDAHLQRIAARNPRLNALTVVFPDRARADAERIDRDVAEGRDPGPLAGVPFSVKENIDLTWSATTHGWRGLAGAVPSRDATIVRRLRAAGAIPIGRGNMPDFGMRFDTDNDLFGRTLNPWDSARTAGGSSGGDAVAVATGMSSFGVGNDFGGSVRIPASAVGVFGLRPSKGRVPRSAVRDIPVAMTLQEFAVHGFLSRSVRDLDAVLAIAQGWDADDPGSLELTASDPRKWPRRVAVVRAPAGGDVDPEVASAVDRAARALADAGWELVDAPPPLLEEAAVLWRRLACTDMLLTLAPDRLPQPLGRSATAFLRDSTAAARPYESALEYAEAWARRAVIAAEWRRFQADVPLILGPVSTARVPLRDYDLGGQDAATAAWRDLRLTVAVNFLGLPSVAAPAGVDRDGLPLGVQVIAPLLGDALALAAAADLETGLGSGARR